MGENEGMDFETMHDRQFEELSGLLDAQRMKALQNRLEEMNEFDVAEFLTEVDTQRMPMVFRLLSKGKAAEVFANLEAPEQELIINSITDSELGAIIEDLYVDDAVDMMDEGDEKPDKSVPQVPRKLSRQHYDRRVRGPEKVHERQGSHCKDTPHR